MNKKLLLGSLLVLTLLLLMPTIPAIQHNIVKEDVKDRILGELSEDLDFKDIKELVDTGKLNDIKYPLLCALVNLYLGFLFLRGFIIFVLSQEIIPGEIPGISTKHPILYLRVLWLIGVKYNICWAFWYIISTKLGWEWPLMWL